MTASIGAHFVAYGSLRSLRPLSEIQRLSLLSKEDNIDFVSLLTPNILPRNDFGSPWYAWQDLHSVMNRGPVSMTSIEHLPVE
ncbi:Uu.00g087960.m01.CDS01 [Anthostomella pinea]|uniref:Uu.00g087960.m01.CDS01 n=1 Tax=Anthostomella pinea TaxID=933095 RepID=A0AAI8VMF5_9PEZI|nr:Uu.00g087960.m01.CDS01 [Anthostomella pinea]